MAPQRKALTLFEDYHGMMSDSIRMQAYEKAIEHAVKPGDIVVDLGAGLGILSLLAVRAGAARVYAIEKSDSIELAKEIARKNGASERIIFVRDNSKNVSLDTKADVLISETMGSFGLDENTLDFTIDARDRLLKPGGKMVPETVTPWLAPVETPGDFEKFTFWKDVLGFDFAPAQDELLARMSLVDIEPQQLLAQARALGSFDLREVNEVHSANKLLFSMTRPGIIHGLAGWFEVQLCPGVDITTAPGAATTHWRQAFFPVREQISIIEGDLMEVSFSIGPKAELSDDTTISYNYRCTQLANERKR